MFKIDNVQDQADMFYGILSTIIDKYSPVQEIVLKNNDKPWITFGFKNLVYQRNNARRKGNDADYKKLRHSVNRLRKILQTNYFNNKIRNLKCVNNHKWWKEIKNLSGINVSDTTSTAFDNVIYNGEELSAFDMPNVINRYLISVANSVAAINHDVLSTFSNELDACPPEFIVSEFDVFMLLNKLKSNKATLNDAISNKLLRTLADVLAAPICSLINTSVRNGVCPTQWKMSRISPIPKSIPVRNLESDIRPIAVTCPVAKVAEHFISKFF